MIDTESLRKKIIELALQGKLTEQLPSDGDAETLYAQILDHKLQLIKEGKIKKDKILPEITADEIPFEIPDNWKWVRLYEISDTNIGLTYHPENIVDEGMVVLRSNNIKNGVFDYSDLVHVNCEVRDNQYIRKNDILICSRNGSKNLVGKCAIYDGEIGDVSFGAFMAILRTSLFKYVYYYLTTDAFRRYFSNDDTKQINQVTQDILKKAIVPLPSLAEQERIVAKLENVLSEIDIIDDLQAKYSNDLAVLKSKIIDAGIQGKLTEQLPEDGDAEDLYAQILNQKSQLIKEGKIKKEKPLLDISADEIPFEIPKNWKWIRLGDVASIYGGKRIPAGRSLTTEDTGHKYIRVSDMKNGTVITDNLLFVPEDIYPSISRYIINKEDVYITVAGTIGKVGKIPAEIDGVNLTENADRIVFEGLSQNWLIRCLSAAVVQKQIESLTTQVAQPKLAIKRIQEFIIPLPPYAEQDRIATKIDAVLEQLN